VEELDEEEAGRFAKVLMKNRWRSLTC